MAEFKKIVPVLKISDMQRSLAFSYALFLINRHKPLFFEYFGEFPKISCWPFSVALIGGSLFRRRKVGGQTIWQPCQMVFFRKFLIDKELSDSHY